MIKILFFGSIADKLGKRDCMLSGCEYMTIDDVLEAVGCVGVQPLLVAVNQEQTHDMDYLVQDGDEVALMPPFSGG